MYVSELRLYDFRQFKSVDGKPGLEVRFHPGLNALVGENGSGKTTVVDAMRYVLLTQSGEFVRPAEDDFNVRADGEWGRRSRPLFHVPCSTSPVPRPLFHVPCSTLDHDKMHVTVGLFHRSRI